MKRYKTMAAVAVLGCSLAAFGKETRKRGLKRLAWAFAATDSSVS